jgi:hypothetical protein
MYDLSLDDIHDSEEDFEIYDDAAMLQAQKDFVESNGSRNANGEVSKKAKLRSERFDNVARNDSTGLDPKWDRFSVG